MEIITEYKRNLPHIQPLGAAFFITFCLKGALPEEVIIRMQETYRLELAELNKLRPENYSLKRYNASKRYFARFDQALDLEKTGSFFLRLPEIARLVAERIRYLADKGYFETLAYCIMPNHVHLVINTAIQLDVLDAETEITTENYRQVYQIMHLLKGGSAYEINKKLNRKGNLWQKESYDHFVRNTKELKNIIHYTLHNPVKAGFVENWQDWEFSYVNENYL
jgi:putative transposase